MILSPPDASNVGRTWYDDWIVNDLEGLGYEWEPRALNELRKAI